MGVLRRCDEALAGGLPVGRTGTDVKVYLALLDAAWKRGALVADIEVRVDDGEEKREGRSAEASPSLDLGNDAFRWGALGSATRTALYLEQVKKATAKEIQHALGSRTLGTIYRHLNRIKDAGLALKEGAIWIWTGASTDELDDYATMARTAGGREEARRVHARDRLDWEEAQARLDERMVLAKKRTHKRAQALVPDEVTGEPVVTFSREEALRLGYLVDLGDSQFVHPGTGEITDDHPGDPTSG